MTNRGLLKFGGKSPGKILTINGSYTQTGSGSYIEQINRAGESDLIIASATGSLDGTLVVDAKDGYGVFKKYHILHANERITGVFSDVIVDNPLVKENIKYTPHDVYIAFQPNLSGFACSKNEHHVANQIDHATDPSSDLQEVLNVMVNSPVNQVCHILDALVGEQYTYLNQLNRYSNEVLNWKIFNAVRNTLTPCYCLDPCHPIQTWCQFEEGQCFANHKRKSNGLRTINWDLNLGILGTFCDKFVLGAAGNYEYSNIKFSKHTHGQTHWNTGQVGVFGAYHGGDFYVFIDGIYGQSWGDIERTIYFKTIHRKAKGSPKTTQGLVYGEIGVNFCWCSILFKIFGFVHLFDQNPLCVLCG